MAEILRPQLEQIVREWRALAVSWNDEDRAAFIARGNEPILFLSTTRVRVLVQCIDVLAHTLEAFDD